MGRKKGITSVSIREHAKKDHSPNWEGSDKWDGKKFTRFFHDAMNYYNLNIAPKDLKPKVVLWMTQNGYEKKTINTFKSIRDVYCGPTMGAIAACLLRGMPAVHKEFNKGRNSIEWLRKQISRVLIEGANDKNEEEVKTVKQVVVSAPTVQDRIREQAIAISESIDYAIDSYHNDPNKFEPKSFKLATLLRTKECKSAQARYIKGFYQFEQNELLTLASGKADEQLREGYSRHPRKNVKKLIEFYADIMSACDQVSAEVKITRKPRARKVKPLTELVSKVKFKLSDDKLGVASVPLVQIIGAQSLVVYNTITRKLGIYIAKTSEGLSVKGTTVLNFTEKSVQKTLRKTTEQLKEFKEQNTQKRFETWFNKNVSTTDTKLTGRLNEDVILLKVWK